MIFSFFLKFKLKRNGTAMGKSKKKEKLKTKTNRRRKTHLFQNIQNAQLHKQDDENSSGGKQ